MISSTQRHIININCLMQFVWFCYVAMIWKFVFFNLDPTSKNRKILDFFSHFFFEFSKILHECFMPYKSRRKSLTKRKSQNKSYYSPKGKLHGIIRFSKTPQDKKTKTNRPTSYNTFDLFWRRTFVIKLHNKGHSAWSIKRKALQEFDLVLSNKFVSRTRQRSSALPLVSGPKASWKVTKLKFQSEKVNKYQVIGELVNLNIVVHVLHVVTHKLYQVNILIVMMIVSFLCMTKQKINFWMFFFFLDFWIWMNF